MRSVTAFIQIGLSDSPCTGWKQRALRQVLHDYFEWATRTPVVTYHQSADDVPNGRRIPRWSWNGLQRYGSVMTRSVVPALYVENPCPATTSLYPRAVWRSNHLEEPR